MLEDINPDIEPLYVIERMEVENEVISLERDNMDPNDCSNARTIQNERPSQRLPTILNNFINDDLLEDILSITVMMRLKKTMHQLKMIVIANEVLRLNIVCFNQCTFWFNLSNKNYSLFVGIFVYDMQLLEFNILFGCLSFFYFGYDMPSLEYFLYY